MKSFLPSPAQPVTEIHPVPARVPTLLAAQQVSLVLTGRQILRNVSLSLAKGEAVTLIGPNGAGKTSLVRLLLGLTPPSSGSVFRAPGVRIGLVPQRLNINPIMPLSVQRLMRLTQRWSWKTAQTALKAVLAQTGAESLLDRQVIDLSGGELQRVLLARALLNEPAILVLDEPVQGVDVQGQTALYALIREVREKLGCAVLMISHDLHMVMSMTDRVICLNQHVCCVGTPQAVSADPAFKNLFGPETDFLTPYRHYHDGIGQIVPLQSRQNEGEDVRETI